ncbi:TetR/AcrR family transcriptional regulator [Arthrobacter castelli]|uniref:TetR/AcrR family transcriptional regulator n=1 Tax=Arthrobacter castelli TaxID=271431 RepID=UPI00047EA2FF|nr:TetR/AcrR family transcriptional regulator [Arthrobacter castelli]
MSDDSGLMTPAGERLLRVAAEVFYREGIAATGVDTIAARAGVSKPTLYAQFGSKRALVAKVLERRHDAQRSSWEVYLTQVDGDAETRLLSVFDWLASWLAESGIRGCGFLNAAAEIPDPADPARAVITNHKRWMRNRLTDLAREAGVAEPAEFGEALLLLIDGVSARVSVEGDLGAAAGAKRAAATLVTASQYRNEQCHG